MNKVYVVGIGPGGEDGITPQARAAMDQAEVLCGYPVYVDLVKGLYPGKETYTSLYFAGSKNGLEILGKT